MNEQERKQFANQEPASDGFISFAVAAFAALFVLVIFVTLVFGAEARRQAERAKPAPRPRYQSTVIIVPKALQDAANAAAIEAAGPYAADTFSVPVVIGGGQQVTHYAASWRMTETQLKAFKAAMTGKQNTVAELARGETPRGKLAELGAERRPDQDVAPGPK